ncbi:putative sodium:inorganic phosphate symporter [Auriculariales sp. MPI-PUGE-AT-0066]|nr:putative sodium:inorganic phosphate symporter [Auriculariales sp. MPI-PUGE-AT-0066]
MVDWIFAVGLVFAILAAFNIGANDVSNSFASSVASRSLTLRQACILGAIFEFLGAVLVGARVAATVKTGIVAAAAFKGNAGVQMLGFAAALVASGSWTMLATAKAWPVSSSYSIVSALAGVGIALNSKAVYWGWNGGSGLAVIWGGMGVAPLVAAAFASIIYLLSKHIVLARAFSLRNGLWFSPFYFFAVAAVVTMSIVYKGSPTLNLDTLSTATVAVAIVLTSMVVTVLAVLFWLPYVYLRVVRKDYTLRWYHAFQGPLLWRRPAPPPTESSAYQSPLTDYRVYDRQTTTTDESVEKTKKVRDAETGVLSVAATSAPSPSSDAPQNRARQGLEPPASARQTNNPREADDIEKRNLFVVARYKLLQLLAHGTSVDVHKMVAEGSGADQLAAIHSQAQQFDNETEHLYSFLQVMTACTNSFAHGANDVGNAIAPFSVIYYGWKHGRVLNDDSEGTPTWILAFGGACMVLGIFTYGYNLMAIMGNRLTLISPSRGFSMAFGSAITVILSSLYAIPVSTTMCITGATVGVGLVSGKGAVNWKAIGWIVLGWVITIPVVGTLAGVITSVIVYGPHF